jgi:hypothetical protein
MKKLLAVCSLVVFASPLTYAQTAPEGMSGFLDVFVVKVKPEKRADFDAISRKIADANRRKGDRWLALDNTYGEGGVVQFSSQRQNYAAIEQATGVFMAAINEGYAGGMKKMMQDFNDTIVSSRAELRRRLGDLSANAPKDQEAYYKMIGQARWLRTIEVRVRTGHSSQFEDAVRQVKAAYEKDGSWTMLVSQLVAGESGTVYYISTLQPSLAGFDSMPDLHKLLGEEAYANIFQKGSSENVLSAETKIMRIVPELSSPPDEVVKVSPDFWNPKPASAMKPKTKTDSTKTGQ